LADQDIRFGKWQDVLRDVPDSSVRLILTSPPYDDARDYAGAAEPVDFDGLADFALRVLAPGGVLAMVIDGAVSRGALSTTPYEVLVKWAKLPGWNLSQVLAYGRQGAPGEYKGRFRRDHEPLLVFVREGAPPVVNKDAVAEVSALDVHKSYNMGRQRERDGSFRQFGVSKDGGIRRTARSIRHRGSIWWYGSVGNGHDPSCSTGHPATFSERFATDAVTVWSNPGDLVLDPFTGSGTVAKVAFDLERSFLGSECVKHYHRLAVDRLHTAIEASNQGQESFNTLFEFGATPDDDA